MPGWLAGGVAAAVLLAAAPAPAGEKNCGEALVCLLTCAKNDAQCMSQCGQGLHPKADKLFAELLMCLAPHCSGMPPDPICLLKAAAAKCGGLYDNCLADAGCEPTCEGKECGDDGCAGSCGSCPLGMTCKDYTCGPCEPDCGGKECGDNGCGGSCGTCPEGFGCIEFQCMECTPQCQEKECGPDGCGGVCGTCTFGADCKEGKCIKCQPNCTGKECGDNGCGGMCGACPPNWECLEGSCVEKGTCKPNCLNKECGDNGCEGSCGTCGATKVCSPQGICVDKSELPEVTEQDSLEVLEEDDGSGPEATAEEDSGWKPPNGSTCPPGTVKKMGVCVPDGGADGGGGGGGGCKSGGRSTNAGALPLAGLLLSMALAARLAAGRRRPKQ